MVSDNDDDLSQRALDYEVTWCTKFDGRPLHESSFTYTRTRTFDYESWHNGENQLVSKFAERKGYTAYSLSNVTATLSCSKKGEVRKSSIHELANWTQVEAMRDRWNDLKLKNLVVKLENH